MPPGQVNSEHAHEFDARLLVLEGEMTVVATARNAPTVPAIRLQ
jgi:quercetin dioxygenase-like cupin family protein